MSKGPMTDYHYYWAKSLLGSTHLRAPAAQLDKETPIGAQRLLPDSRQCQVSRKENIEWRRRLDDTKRKRILDTPTKGQNRDRTGGSLTDKFKKTSDGLTMQHK